jgi:serine/threonine protein kinase
LFYLAPANREAIKVVTSPINSEFRASQRAEEEIGTAALSVGFIPSAKGGKTLLTLGRKGDITIECGGEGISDIHCSFKINPETGVVMLHDNSDNNTTHVRGHAFPERRSRKVAMTPGKYELFNIGRHRKIKFKLVWSGDVEDALVRGKVLSTIRNLDARVESRSSTKKINRCVKAGILGSGRCGIVYRAIDLDTGAVVALKTYKKNDNRSEQLPKFLLRKFAKSEVKNLAKSKHPHIAKFISSSGFDEGRPEIFLRVEEGSLASLLLDTNAMREPSKSEQLLKIGKSVMKQMLEALHYLNTKGIVHRDVKPQNILYSTRSKGRYRFVLADFGLSECTSVFSYSWLSVGTMVFMAPETFEYCVKLTTKIDVWALYVTMLVVYDIDGFAKNCLKCNNHHQVHDLVRKIKSKRHSLIEPFREMASTKPENRASARRILKQWPAITWPQVNEEATLSDGSESDRTGSFYTAYKGHGSDRTVSDGSMSDTSAETPRSRRNTMPATLPESVRQSQMEFFRKYQVADSDCDTWSETEESKTPRRHTVKSFGTVAFDEPRRTVNPRGVPDRLSCNLQAVVFDELFRDQ